VKKIAGFLAIGVLTLGLTACGSSSKETMINANKEFMNVKSMEADYAFKLDVKLDGADAETKKAVEAINNSSITIKHLHDSKSQKDEMTLGVKFKMDPLSMDAKIPFLVDGKNEKVYLEPSKVMDSVGLFFPMLGDMASSVDLEGKFLEIDMNSKEFGSEFSSFSADNEKIQKIVEKEVISALEKKDEKDFVEKDGKITVKFNQAELKSIIKNILLGVNEVMPKKEQESKEELTKSIDEMFSSKEAKIKGLTVVSEIDNGKIVSEKYIIGLEGNMEGQKYSVDVTVHSKFSKVNEKIDFTISPKKENIITIDELEKAYSEMNGGF